MIAGSIPFAILPAVLGALFIDKEEEREELSIAAARFALVALVTSILMNLSLAQYALSSYDQRAFGMLFFTPALKLTSNFCRLSY